MFKLVIVLFLSLFPRVLFPQTPPTILVLGDSLSASYGIEDEKGWVNLLQARLTANGYAYRVVNASISGDTTRGGLSRLPAALDRHRPNIVIIELGGNDGLRGLSLEEMHTQLGQLIELSQARGARVLLAGMRLPPNYGQAYTKAFANVYRDLAARYELPLVPFLLEGVGGLQAMMQSDGLHPTEEAQAVILENLWPVLQPLLERRHIGDATSFLLYDIDLATVFKTRCEYFPVSSTAASLPPTVLKTVARSIGRRLMSGYHTRSIRACRE